MRISLVRRLPADVLTSARIIERFPRSIPQIARVAWVRKRAKTLLAEEGFRPNRQGRHFGQKNRETRSLPQFQCFQLGQHRCHNIGSAADLFSAAGPPQSRLYPMPLQKLIHCSRQQLSTVDPVIRPPPQRRPGTRKKIGVVLGLSSSLQQPQNLNDSEPRSQIKNQERTPDYEDPNQWPSN